jgi:hypothetical protein
MIDILDPICHALGMHITIQSGFILLTQFNESFKNELNHNTFVPIYFKWNLNHYIIVMFTCNWSISIKIIIIYYNLLMYQLIQYDIFHDFLHKIWTKSYILFWTFIW